MSTFGPSKKVVNGYVASIARGKTLVLDTSALGTSRALAKTVGKSNTTVFGIDPNLEKESKRFGIKCVKGWSGDVLETLGKIKYDLIYLDYCGTPDGNASFDPMEDMARASTMLTRGGVLACTFCKRCPSVLSKCVNMAPPTLSLQRSFEYCDTSAMIFVVYSARRLPQIGPPVGSIIRIQHWTARVEEVYLDGMRLVLVKKGATGWVLDTSESELWEEPFTAIDDVIEIPSKKTKQVNKSKKQKKKSNSRTLDLHTFIGLMKASTDTPEKVVSKEKKVNKEKDMPKAIKRFKEWFDECINTTEYTTSFYLQKKAALDHYKSWCSTKGIVAEHCLSDRCNSDCKANRCPLNTCTRFLCHMCDALGFDNRDKSGKFDKERKTRKNNDGDRWYKAYFKEGKATDVKLKSGAVWLVQTAKYKE